VPYEDEASDVADLLVHLALRVPKLPVHRGDLRAAGAHSSTQAATEACR
jgi:hypothetical protein